MPLTSYENFEDILESITDGFLAVDAQWKITYFNRQAESVLGIARHSVMGRLLWEVTPFEAEVPFQVELRRVLDTGEEVRFEAYATSRDQWLKMRAFPLKSGGMAAYFQDITPQKWAEEAIAEHELRLEQALEAGEMGAWRINFDDRSLESTPICRTVYGLEAEAPLTLEGLFQRIHPDDRERVYAVMSRSFEQHIPFRVQYRVVWPNGDERWVSSHGRLAYDMSQSRRQLVGISFDITARKTMALERERLLREAQIAQSVAEQAQEVAEHAQSEAERSREQAVDASRLKDEFLATLSHELRTPLMAIIGWADMLTNNVLDSQQQAQAAEVILRNARQQAQLVEDVLDVSRIITGKMRLQPRDMELGAVLRGAIDSIELTAQKRNVSLEVQLDEAPCHLQGDPDRLQQVVWNLLSNSIKFTPPKGRVCVTLTCAPHEAVVTVTDSGRGIAPDVLPYIFDRLRQGDSSSTRSFGGLGIGLSLVRHMVELHGGTVDAHSEGIGRGAQFRIRIPNSGTSLPGEVGSQVSS